MSKTKYFVSATQVFAVVEDSTAWIKTNASTLNGAKRAATKAARSATFTARVATKTESGQFQTIASIDDSSAITRRRATWREYNLKGAQQDEATS
jgi:hypothetical protein